MLTFVVKSQRNNLIKFNSRKKHVIMLIKTVGYRHCPLVKGFKVVISVPVSRLRCFIEFSRGVSIFRSCR